MTRALKMQHDVDPRQSVLDEAAPYIDGVSLPAYHLLIAVYKRPEMLKSGIILPGTSGPRKEDEWQGKVGLVLKVGPFCYTGENENRFERTPVVGSWVAINVGDTWAFNLWDLRCRHVHEDDVKMILDNPDCVY